MNKRELPRYIFWEWIEPIGSALCIALLVMKFVMAIYVIPTGSMQPTLHGAGNYPGHGILDLYGGGDKVMVNKFVYRLNPPERWDVIVFEYPFNILYCGACKQDLIKLYDKKLKAVPADAVCPYCGSGRRLKFIQKDYIKRCAALPGDEITVVDGNILLRVKDKAGAEAWTWSRKTAEAQEALWVPEVDMLEHPENFSSSWLWTRGTPPSDMSHGLVLADDELRFASSQSLRGWGDTGESGDSRRVDAGLVGDLRLAVELAETPADGVLELNISRNGVSHLLQVDFAARQARVFSRSAGQPLTTIALPGSALEKIALARVDGRILVYVDEKLHAFDIPGENPLEKTQSILPRLSYKGKGLTIRNLSLDRDVYYDDASPVFDRSPGRTCKLQSGEYFAMGDNSYHSADSRNWGPVPEHELIGKALAVILPFGRVKLIH